MLVTMIVWCVASDLSSLKKASAEEVAATLANCHVRAFGPIPFDEDMRHINGATSCLERSDP